MHYLGEFREWALKCVLGSDGVCVPNAFGKCSEGNYFVLIQADTIVFSLNKMPITSHFCVRKRDGQYWMRSKHCWDLLRWRLSCEETHIGAIFSLVAQLNFAFREPVVSISLVVFISLQGCRIIRKMPMAPRRGRARACNPWSKPLKSRFS